MISNESELLETLVIIIGFKPQLTSLWTPQLTESRNKGILIRRRGVDDFDEVSFFLLNIEGRKPGNDSSPMSTNICP